MDLTESTDEWLKFDIRKILDLKDIYCEVMEFVQQDLPEINLNSTNQIKEYYWDRFNSVIPDTKIQTFQNLMDMYPDNHPIYEISEQLVVYLKAKYILKNYINCILTYADKDGKMMLRDDSVIAMPNRQKLPYSPEVLECLMEGSSAAMKIININRENNKSL